MLPRCCAQIFDSWGGQLPPREWDRWSGPYIKRIVQSVKAVHPTVPLTLYANGSGGLLERIKATGVDVVGIDWTVDMADARARLGNDVSLQGNIDPTILFASHVSMARGGAYRELRPHYPVCAVGPWSFPALAGGYPTEATRTLMRWQGAMDAAWEGVPRPDPLCCWCLCRTRSR